MATNLKVRFGDTACRLRLQLKWLDKDTIFDGSTADDLLFTVKRSTDQPDSAALVQKQKTIGGFYFGDDHADGWVEIGLVDTDWDSLTPDDIYNFGIRASVAGYGEVGTITVAEGTLRVLPTTTQELNPSVPIFTTNPLDPQTAAARAEAAATAAEAAQSNVESAATTAVQAAGTATTQAGIATAAAQSASTSKASVDASVATAQSYRDQAASSAQLSTARAAEALTYQDAAQDASDDAEDARVAAAAAKNAAETALAGTASNSLVCTEKATQAANSAEDANRAKNTAFSYLAQVQQDSHDSQVASAAAVAAAAQAQESETVASAAASVASTARDQSVLAAEQAVAAVGSMIVYLSETTNSVTLALGGGVVFTETEDPYPSLILTIP